MPTLYYTLILLFANMDHTSTMQVRDIYGKEACEVAGKELETKLRGQAKTLAWSCAPQVVK